jgi:hypothetical protein
METKLQNLVKQVGTDVSGKWIAVDKIDQLAESIVRECMEVVSKKCASPTAYNALVEHFGVE